MVFRSCLLAFLLAGAIFMAGVPKKKDARLLKVSARFLLKVLRIRADNQLVADCSNRYETL
jgi:hypothetical protein